MKYIIGITITKKSLSDKSSKEGLYAINNNWGLSEIITEKNATKENLEKLLIPVFDNSQDAENFCRILAKCYRRDDVGFNKTLKSRYVRDFYPLKLSKFFPLKFHLKILIKEGSNYKQKIKCNIYGEKVDYVTLEVPYYKLKIRD